MDGKHRVYVTVAVRNTQWIDSVERVRVVELFSVKAAQFYTHALIYVSHSHSSQ